MNIIITKINKRLRFWDECHIKVEKANEKQNKAYFITVTAIRNEFI